MVNSLDVHPWSRICLFGAIGFCGYATSASAEERADTASRRCEALDIEVGEFDCVYAQGAAPAEDRLVLGSTFFSSLPFARQVLPLLSDEDDEDVVLLGGLTVQAPLTASLATPLLLEQVGSLAVRSGGFAADTRGSTGSLTVAELPVGSMEHRRRFSALLSPSLLRGPVDTSGRVAPRRLETISQEASIGDRGQGTMQAQGPLGTIGSYSASIAITRQNIEVARSYRRHQDLNQDGLPDLDERGARVRAEVFRESRTIGDTAVPFALHMRLQPLTGTQLEASAVGHYRRRETVKGFGDPEATDGLEINKSLGATVSWLERWNQKRSQLRMTLASYRLSLHSGGASRLGNAQPQVESGLRENLYAALPDQVIEACDDLSPNDPFPLIENCEFSIFPVLRGGVGRLRDERDATHTASFALRHQTRKHSASGRHWLLLGGDLERQSATVHNAFSGGLTRSESGIFPGSETRYVELGVGPAFDENCAALDEAPESCRVLDRTTRPSYANSSGLYLEDRWSPAKQLTISAGARADWLDYDGAAKLTGLSPRLGAAWDVLGGGRSRLYGYWGRIPSRLLLAAAQRVFQSEPLLLTENGAKRLLRSENLADPGALRFQHQDEFRAGWEQLLGDELRFGTVYVHQTLDDVIEDKAAGESPVIGNVDSPVASRVRDALTLSAYSDLDKARALRVSYSLSALRGGYPGAFDGDTSRFSPNLHAAFDDAAFDANRIGILPDDRRHRLQVEGWWRQALGAHRLVLGSRITASSGAPQSAMGGHELYGANEIFLLPRGQQGRGTTELDASLRLGYSHALSEGRLLGIYVDLLSVLSSWIDPNVAASNRYTIDAARGISGGRFEDLVYLKRLDQGNGAETGQPVSRDRGFRRAVRDPGPFVARLGLELVF